MKKFLVFIFIGWLQTASGQELYVSTEPASNMATGSVGFRLNSRIFKMKSNGDFSTYRIEPEIMIGATKKIMLHVAAYGSDMFQQKFRIEGASLYGKYRFFSQDEVHEHFRMAAYAKVSMIKNPQELISGQLHYKSDDIDIDGNTSGVSGGVVATQLVNKLALSGSVGYVRRLNNIDYKTDVSQPVDAITYTASAGYLLFPKEYTSYHQTNLNIYIEMLGQSLDKHQYYIDAAPAIQFIFNSIARLDIGYRAQVSGRVQRLSDNNFMVRFEYNILNAFGKK